MSKEIVDGIRNAIEEAQRAKNLREEQETSKKRTEDLRQGAEHQASIAQNEARLRATGVVELFEELRDSKVLTMSKAGDPAVVDWLSRRDIVDMINWNSLRTEISILFDGHFIDCHDRNGDWYPSVETNCLKARIVEKGVLQIGQHEMKPGEELGEVVRDEILKLKGLKE